jgi:hypothetical protein
MATASRTSGTTLNNQICTECVTGVNDCLAGRRQAQAHPDPPPAFSRILPRVEQEVGPDLRTKGGVVGLDNLPGCPSPLVAVGSGVVEKVLAPGWLRRRALAARASAHAARGAIRSAGGYLDDAIAMAVAERHPGEVRAYEQGKVMLALLTGSEGFVSGASGGDDTDLARAQEAFVAAMFGDTAQARSLLSDLHGRSNRDLDALRAWPKLLQASLLVRAGRWDRVPATAPTHASIRLHHEDPGLHSS